jgi:hypothetical protein
MQIAMESFGMAETDMIMSKDSKQARHGHDLFEALQKLVS